MKRSRTAGLIAALALTPGVLAVPSADAAILSTTDKICNSSLSHYDVTVSLYLGSQVGTIIYPLGPGMCVDTTRATYTTDRKVFLTTKDGSHRVGYDYGPYSSCRKSPNDFFQPANEKIIYFKTYAYKPNCTN